MVISESNPCGSRTKAIWDLETVDKFINLCVAEVEARNRPKTTFSKVGWDNLVKNLGIKTNREYTKLQLKNKWDSLKVEWKSWKQLIGKKTSLRWNDKKKIVDASNEWWQSKLQENPDLVRFCKEGFSPMMEEKLDVMFMNIVATSEHKYSSSSNIREYDNLDGSNNLTSINESGSDKSRKTILKNKKDKYHIKFGSKIDKFKKTTSKKKTGGLGKFLGALDNLVEEIKGRSDTTYIVRKEKPGTSIAEVIEVVKSLPRVGIRSPL